MLWKAVAAGALLCAALLAGGGCSVGERKEDALSPFSERNLRKSAEEQMEIARAFVDLPPATQRSALHWALEKGITHDPCIMLAQVGDETSVPHLIRALERKRPMTCSHCWEVLEEITNNRPGDRREAWERWWGANRRKTRMEWVHDGFRAEGFSVTVPPDARYLSELIGALSAHDARDFAATLAKNARMVLQGEPGPDVLAQARKLADSLDPRERLGAVEALFAFGGDESLTLLEALAKDGERPVREQAQARVNDILRGLPECRADGAALWKGSLGDEILFVAPGTGDNTALVGYEFAAGGGEGRFLGLLDLDTGREIWTLPLDLHWEGKAVTHKDSILVKLRGGRVACRRKADGGLLWSDGDMDQFELWEDTLYAGSYKHLRALDAHTGKQLWRVGLPGRLRSLDCASGTLVLEMEEEEEIMFLSGEQKFVRSKAVPRSKILGVMGGMPLVCADESCKQACVLHPETLETVWCLPDAEGYTLSAEMVQEGPLAVIRLGTDRHALIDSATGTTLSSFNDLDDLLGMSGSFLLARRSSGELEVRDLHTGRVVRVYEDMGYLAPNCLLVAGNRLLAASRLKKDWKRGDTNLWLLRFPQGGREDTPARRP